MIENEEVNNTVISPRNETRNVGETSNEKHANAFSTEENHPAAVLDLQNIRQLLMENEENSYANIIPRNSQETRTFGETSNEQNRGKM